MQIVNCLDYQKGLSPIPPRGGSLELRLGVRLSRIPKGVPPAKPLWEHPSNNTSSNSMSVRQRPISVGSTTEVAISGHLRSRAATDGLDSCSSTKAVEGKKGDLNFTRMILSRRRRHGPIPGQRCNCARALETRDVGEAVEAHARGTGAEQGDGHEAREPMVGAWHRVRFRRQGTSLFPHKLDEEHY